MPPDTDEAVVRNAFGVLTRFTLWSPCLLPLHLPRTAEAYAP